MYVLRAPYVTMPQTSSVMGEQRVELFDDKYGSLLAQTTLSAVMNQTIEIQD